MRAAVFPGVGQDIQIESIDDPIPGPGEVLVGIAAAGLCHSDLHVIKGEVPFPTPSVLGHEVSGVVVEIGHGVTGHRVGERVVASFILPCGSCRHCLRGSDDLCERFRLENRRLGVLYDGDTRLRRPDGSPVWVRSMGGFADLAVIPASAVFAIPGHLPLATSAVLGCSVLTAVGAVRNASRLVPGATAAVVAVGGVGLNIVQVAAAFEASRIVAMDVNEDRLDLALKLGATEAINLSEGDGVRRLREINGGRGVDVSFEALGSPSTLLTAIESVDEGGRVVVVGIPPAHVTTDLDVTNLVRRKISLVGSYGGRPSVDMQLAIDLAAEGLINLDLMVAERFPLEEINHAFRLLDAGAVRGRAILEP